MFNNSETESLLNPASFIPEHSILRNSEPMNNSEIVASNANFTSLTSEQLKLSDSESMNNSEIVSSSNDTDLFTEVSNNDTLFATLQANMLPNESLDSSLEVSFLSSQTALYIYTFFILSVIVMCITRNLIFYKICMNASRNLHDNMFARLLRAPLRFFEVNPSGIFKIK